MRGCLLGEQVGGGWSSARGDLGFRVKGWVEGLGFGVKSLGFWVKGLGLRVKDSGFRAWEASEGAGFCRVWELGVQRGMWISGAEA